MQYVSVLRLTRNYLKDNLFCHGLIEFVIRSRSQVISTVCINHNNGILNVSKLEALASFTFQEFPIVLRSWQLLHLGLRCCLFKCVHNYQSCVLRRPEIYNSLTLYGYLPNYAKLTATRWNTYAL